MAVIQTHICKTELSKAYHNAGVIHFLQSGTDMKDSDGSDYGNKHAWCDSAPPSSPHHSSAIIAVS